MTQTPKFWILSTTIGRIHIYIYIYREREREIDIDRYSLPPGLRSKTLFVKIIKTIQFQMYTNLPGKLKLLETATMKHLLTNHSFHPPGWGWGSKVCPSVYVYIYIHIINTYIYIYIYMLILHCGHYICRYSCYYCIIYRYIYIYRYRHVSSIHFSGSGCQPFCTRVSGKRSRSQRLVSPASLGFI